MHLEILVSRRAASTADAAEIAMSATLPKPPSLIASRTQTISSVSFEDAPATPPTRGEPANKAFATPAHRKVPETPLGPTPPKPDKQASSHLDVKTPPRVKAKNVTPSGRPRGAPADH